MVNASNACRACNLFLDDVSKFGSIPSAYGTPNWPLYIASDPLNLLSQAGGHVHYLLNMSLSWGAPIQYLEYLIGHRTNQLPSEYSLWPMKHEIGRAHV